MKESQGVYNVRMASLTHRVEDWLGKVSALRALRHPDFRLLWIGALFSFTGSQIQSVAQGYYVYEMTNDKSKLALVMFFWALPVMVLAPFSGAVADRLNRKTVLAWSQVLLMMSSAALAIAFYTHTLQFWHIYVTAFIGGIIQNFEAPARQSIVRTVVGEEDLSSAIPMQAMTFNLARIAGPALGGVLASFGGAGICFAINSFSFLALIFAAILIKADLRPTQLESSSIQDLLLDGIRFTFRHKSLRVLFLMEAATSVFGMFYLSQMPAIAKSMLGLDQAGLGICNSFIGAGALIGLGFVSTLSQKPIKPLLVRIAMLSFAFAMMLLGFVNKPIFAYPIFMLMGASAIMQFNVTNTLFQLMAPDRLRGRVIAMHLWAISGLSPIGIYAFGQIAEKQSLNIALWIGAGLLALCWLVCLPYSLKIKETPLDPYSRE